MRTEQDIWRYRQGLDVATTDVTGFDVEALDGGIGKIDEATNEASASSVVVDTGPWILGKKVLLPAGVIDTIDFDTQTVFVNRTKEEIKNAPEFDPDKLRDETYRTQLGSYYAEGGSGYRQQRTDRSETV